MPPREYSSLRQRDNGRSAQKSLAPERSVDDFFSSSTFLTASPYKSKARRDASPGAPVFRYTNSDYQSRTPEATQKQSDSSSRESTKITFHWIKGELIGRGSHGRVYLGFNATNGEIIAVKQVEIPTTADDLRKAALKDFVQRLREERKTLRDLYHPNIVQYLGYEENPETVNIFLEYVSGGTINGCLLEHGPFKEDVTKSFTTQILKGLSYLHSKDIIHRDLKSDNILIDPDGICKISDFGISKKLEKPRTHTFQGTYNWMAPEIFSDDIKQVGYDEKVDIWSVGCIVLEMWTGNKPWNDEHVLNIMNMMAEKHSPPLPKDLNLTVLANEFKKECFQVDPAQRPRASLLVTHPYLTLPIGWTYPGMNNMGSKTKTLFESVEVEAEGEEDSVATLSLPAPIPPRPISPPLVFIAPPPPRKLPSPQASDSWPATTRNRSTSNASVSSGSQDSKPHRRLAMHNPDTVPDLTVAKRRDLPRPPRPPPFVYRPPPLPETTAPTPYSNQLGPQVKHADVYPSSTPLRYQQASATDSLAAFASLSLPTKTNHMGPANYKDIMAQQQTTDSFPNSYSDATFSTDSTSSSLWQKAPPNVVSRSRSVPSTAGLASQNPSATPRKRPSLPPNPPQRAQQTKLFNVQKQSPVATNARPQSRDVLEHMKFYFPNHDLDEPVVSSEADARYVPNREIDVNTTPTRRFTMKSIKAIAEEQIHRDLGCRDRRRQTLLWDSHMEEIKAPVKF